MHHNALFWNCFITSLAGMYFELLSCEAVIVY